MNRPPLASDLATGCAATVTDAAQSRRSVRAFLDMPVDRATVEAILGVAAWAPSGSNLQPWQVDVASGPSLARLTAALTEAFLRGEPEQREYRYYTDPVSEPYLSRRRACGWGLYGTLGITREDKSAMRTQRAGNYRFFGAPVGLVVSIDRTLEKGSWVDCGLFIQTILLAAREHGLHTCPQASIGQYPDIVRGELGISSSRIIICGIALGHADPQAAVNRFQPERLALSDFARFHD
jgi:nitroreductase